MEEKYEVTYAEQIYEDFIEAGLSKDKVQKIDDKMNFVALSPWSRTEGIENQPIRTLRKTRFGDFRMFVDINDLLFTMTCLAFLNRNKCYKAKDINKILTRIVSLQKSIRKD